MVSLNPNLMFLLLILLCIKSTVQTNDEFDPYHICTLIANGTKIKDPRTCHSYVECINQQPMSRSCGKQFYDRNSAECLSSETTKCLSSDPCAAKPNGFTSDPYSCNGYYYCSNGHGVRGECSPGMNFNPETENCIRDFPCEISLYPEDECNIIPDGVFIKDSLSCRNYRMCWKSQLINGTCPNGFYLNATAGICDYPHYVDCVDVTTPEPEKPENVKCSKGDEFIADGRTCNGYYYCQAKGEEGAFNLIHSVCPTNRFFDANNGGACVMRTQIACPYDRCVTLGQEAIQMANIANDDCRGFSICQTGREIARAVCPEGEYFDEIQQRCTETVVLYPACEKL